MLLSPSLLDEYRRILREPDKVAQHGLDDDTLESLVDDTASQGTVIVPAAAPERAPDPDDQHVWDLLTDPDHTAILVTLDRRLLNNPPRGSIVISPRQFVERYLPKHFRG